jgi:hypothetical protein
LTDTTRQTHPSWQNRVAIVPLSIDDTLKIVRDHVDKRGWTNTFNVWAEDGGWHSKPATAFRVHVVPTTYIIDMPCQSDTINPHRRHIGASGY